jgi:hypothetical protein
MAIRRLEPNNDAVWNNKAIHRRYSDIAAATAIEARAGLSLQLDLHCCSYVMEINRLKPTGYLA